MSTFPWTWALSHGVFRFEAWSGLTLTASPGFNSMSSLAPALKYRACLTSRRFIFSRVSVGTAGFSRVVVKGKSVLVLLLNRRCSGELSNPSVGVFLQSRRATILVKSIETLVSVSLSPVLIWVSQWSQCLKTRVAQHWGERRHISGGKTVWSRNVRIFPENLRETVSVSTICDEYCGHTGLDVSRDLEKQPNSTKKKARTR